MTDNKTLLQMAQAIRQGPSREALELIDQAASILKSHCLLSEKVRKKLVEVKHSVQKSAGLAIDPPDGRTRKILKDGYVAVIYRKDDVNQLTMQAVATTEELAEFGSIPPQKAGKILRQAKKHGCTFRLGGTAYGIEVVKIGDRAV